VTMRLSDRSLIATETTQWSARVTPANSIDDCGRSGAYPSASLDNTSQCDPAVPISRVDHRSLTEIWGATVERTVRRQDGGPHMCGRNAEERVSNIVNLRAPGFFRQHAIDTWESEGGGLVSAPGGGLASAFAGRDFGRTALAGNAGLRASSDAGWSANDAQRDAPKNNGALDPTLAFPSAGEDDQILRCLGTAVIMRWNTIPRKLQRDLFDNASSMGELLQADALKGRIARFLHKHKDDAG